MCRHHRPPPTNTGLRFRLYIDGQLLDELWVYDMFAAHAAAASQGGVAAQAIRHGLPYLVEVFDPDAQPEHAHVRFGNDTAGMGRPIDPPPDWFPLNGDTQ